MLTFTLSDLIDATEKVTDAADRAAVKLLSESDAYVILRLEDFEHMQWAARMPEDPRRVFLTHELPQDVLDVLLADVPDVALADLPIVRGTRVYDPSFSEEDGLRLVAKPGEE